MYHSITFGENLNWTEPDSTKKNTWEDWHLVPSSRPVFNPPSQKTQYVDIPGADGSLDLSQAISKYPVYENRSGSFEFHVMQGYEDWTAIYEKVSNYLNGKTLLAVLEDEPQYYYEGRFKVTEWTSNNDGTGSTITIKYVVKPYKNFVQSASEDWLWDPFSFYTGVIQTPSFKDITINGTNWTEVDVSDFIGEKPIVPTFKGSNIVSDSYIAFYNPDMGFNWFEKKIQNGTFVYPDVVLAKVKNSSVIKIRYKGNAKLTIDFRSGRI